MKKVHFLSLKVVLKDSSFKSDDDKINIKQTFKEFGPETDPWVVEGDLMIRKIDIESFGIYKNFIWQRERGLGGKLFKRLNIIYGRNYSGKTTLSRIFRSIEKRGYPEFIDNPKFIVYFDDEKKDQDEIFDIELNVIVYNDDFIKENLQFFYDENKHIKSFKVTVGEKNKEILKEIDTLSKKKEKIQKIKEKIEEKFNTTTNNYDNNSKELENLLRNKANKEIKTNSVYGLPNYDVRSIKKDIEKINKIDRDLKNLLNEKEKNKLAAIIKEEKKPIHRFNSFNFEINILDEVVKRVEAILKEEIKPSKIIEELIRDYNLEVWVREGIRLHKNKRETCAFCGNKISKERYEELDKHFDKANEEFERNIEKIKKEVEEITINFDLNENSFYEEYKEQYKEVRKLIEKSSESLSILKEELMKELNKKIKNKTKVLDINKSIIEKKEDLKKCLEKLKDRIVDLIKGNNSYSESLEKKQNEAKEKLRLNAVKVFLKTINYFDRTDRIKEIEAKKDILETRKKRIEQCINEVIEKIQELNDSLSDEKKSVEYINEFLKFSSSHLQLDIQECDDKQIYYEILREGRKARKISNGEQSLIAFCYFLAKAVDKLKNESDVIIYIDDPVSSLDNNHIFSIYALLEKYITKNKNYLQCFISTHNLDFLRYLKRITVPKTIDNYADIEHFMTERTYKKGYYESRIISMPEHIKKYTTELHYLFEKIFRFYCKIKNNRNEAKHEVDNTFNSFYEIPNNLRKFLEYYLFYKYPDSDGLTNEKLSFFGAQGQAEKIGRVVNEFSHLTYVDRAWKPIDFEEIADVVELIIDTIKNKDREYIMRLIKSCSLTNCLEE